MKKSLLSVIAFGVRWRLPALTALPVLVAGVCAPVSSTAFAQQSAATANGTASLSIVGATTYAGPFGHGILSSDLYSVLTLPGLPNSVTESPQEAALFPANDQGGPPKITNILSSTGTWGFVNSSAQLSNHLNGPAATATGVVMSSSFSNTITQADPHGGLASLTSLGRVTADEFALAGPGNAAIVLTTSLANSLGVGGPWVHGVEEASVRITEDLHLYNSTTGADSADTPISVFVGASQSGVDPFAQLTVSVTGLADSQYIQFNKTDSQVEADILSALSETTTESTWLYNLTNLDLFSATVTGTTDQLVVSFDTQTDVGIRSPEPASAVLLLSGLAGMATLRRRSRIIQRPYRG